MTRYECIIFNFEWMEWDKLSLDLNILLFFYRKIQQVNFEQIYGIYIFQIQKFCQLDFPSEKIRVKCSGWNIFGHLRCMLVVCRHCADCVKKIRNVELRLSSISIRLSRQEFVQITIHNPILTNCIPIFLILTFFVS